MGTVLIISEKPLQAKQYADAFNGKKNGDHFEILPCSELPQGAIVVSAAGHIVELFDAGEYKVEWKDWTLNTLPIIPEKFRYKVVGTKRSFYNTIKKFVHDPKVSTVVHAGDAAREGELLLLLPLMMMGNKKPIKRLWTSSLTKESIRKAFRNLKDIKETHSLYLEALARQHSDWLIGISSSRALTILLRQKGINKTFSCGRVQSALMGIIYQREIEIEQFVSQPYWDCYAEFTFGNSTLTGKWFKEDTDHIFSKDAAEALVQYCSNQKAHVYSVTTEEKKIRPPHLFNLDTLQTEANRLFGMPTSTVLGIAQSLYEKGLLSYPRSASMYVTPAEASQFPTILKNLSEIQAYSPFINRELRDISTDSRYTDSSKVEDHYAIIPTEQKVNPITLPKGEQLIYDLVAKSLIAAHYPDYIYDLTQIVLLIDNSFSFKRKGKQVKELGWKAIYEGSHQDEISSNENEMLLPNLEAGDMGVAHSLELKEGATQPPNRFSEGDLIKIMANSTYYISNRDGFSNEELSLGTPATRAGIIGTIKSRYVNIEKNLVYLLPEGRILIQALGQNSYLTSVLTTGKMEKHLTNIGKGKASYDAFLEGTKKITSRIVKELIEDSSAWDFTEYQKQIQGPEEIGICRLCGSPVVDKGNFYGCTGYQQHHCQFKISKAMLGKSISKENAIKLLETGTTALIKDFKSKSKDKTFDAFLTWDNQKQTVVFRFPSEIKG